jgi:hypothetical protein
MRDSPQSVFFLINDRNTQSLFILRKVMCNYFLRLRISALIKNKQSMKVSTLSRLVTDAQFQETVQQKQRSLSD